MSTMRRALLSGHGRVFYFLFLILCIPVIENDADLPKHPEKSRFFCNQPDLYGNSGPSLILESFIAKDSLSPDEPNQTLNKTLWALKFDREVWHGELVDAQHSESASDASLSHEVDNQGSKVENTSNSLQEILISATQRESKGGKGILFMHCNPINANSYSAGHNNSAQVKCLSTSTMQSSTSIMAGEALPDKVQVLMRPTPHVSHTMAFELHKQCSWPHEGHASSTVFSFFERNRAVQTLELDFDFPALKQSTLRERINRLLDERITKTACNQGMSREFMAKNMRTLPLQVHSLMIKGMTGETHGFKVEYVGDFYLAPGQSTRLHVSYWPDLKSGIANGELQLVTSAGTISVGLQANVPKHIQCFCQNAALMVRAKRIILQVCSLALFLVLLVFGRMLKQEGLIMSDVSQWSTSSNSAKLSEKAAGSSMQYHDDKRSSIYVSIDIGCTQNESKQCGLSLTKALDVVHAAINCMVGLKFLYVFHPLNAHQAELNITKKCNLHPSTQDSNDSSSSTSSMTGKRRASTHLRAYTRSASTSASSVAALSSRSKACSVKDSKAIPQLDVARPLEKTEPESPPAHSDKEKERAKQRKKKKGVPSLSPGVDIGSDSGSSSPLSMPSSPVTREMLCRPVSPLCSDTRSSIQKCKIPAKMDAAMTSWFGKDGNRESQTDSRFYIREKCSLQATGNNFSFEDPQTSNSYALHSRNFPKSLNPEGKTSEAKSIANLSERNLVKVAAVRNSSQDSANTRVRGATLTASATFPAPGRRSFQESICVGQEDGQNQPIVWSSSISSDLVSTSAVAPHARAPGSPLSPKSPSFSRNTLSSSLLTVQGGSHQNTQHGNLMCTVRSSQRGNLEGKPRHTQDMFYHSGYGRSSPLRMHEPHHAQKRQDVRHGSDSVVLYDMWGDHFADLGRRWGPYWTGKDVPITRKPSSLPPLLQTPPFSVFSCNDPFNR